MFLLREVFGTRVVYSTAWRELLGCSNIIYLDYPRRFQSFLFCVCGCVRTEK